MFKSVIAQHESMLASETLAGNVVKAEFHKGALYALRLAKAVYEEAKPGMVAVELRMRCACSKTINSDLIYIVSDKEKALNFINQNRDFGGDYKTWWWTIYTVEADRLPIEYDDLEFYSKDGVKLDTQP